MPTYNIDAIQRVYERARFSIVADDEDQAYDKARKLLEAGETSADWDFLDWDHDYGFDIEVEGSRHQIGEQDERPTENQADAGR